MEITRPVPGRAVEERRHLNLLVGVLTANLFIHNTASTMLGPLLVELAKSLHTTVPLVGQLAAATSVTWAIFGIMAGPLSDRYGRRPLLLGGVALFAATTALCGFAWSFGSLLVFRLLAGIGASTVGPNSSAIVADYFPANRRGSALGWLMTGQSFSQLVGLPMVAVIAGLAGWRWTFWAVALVYGLLVVLLLLTIPPDNRAAPKSADLFGGYREIAGQPQALILLGANAIARTVFGALTVYLAAFVVETYHLSVVAVAPVLAVAALGTLLGAIVGGRLTDRMRKRDLAVWTLLAQGLIVLPLFAWTPSVWATALLAGLFSVANSANRPVFMWMLTNVSERSRGTVMGATALTNQTGIIVGSGIGGLLLSVWSYGAIGTFAAVCSFLGAAVVLRFLAEPRPR